MSCWILEHKVKGRWTPLSVATSLKRLKANAPFHQSPSRMRKYRYAGEILDSNQTSIFFHVTPSYPRPRKQK